MNYGGLSPLTSHFFLKFLCNDRTLILVLVLFPLSLATNWQHQIYVSSSDGVNDSSCWTGHVPCATLNLAVEGIQHNSTVIYLYPGIYTFENGMIKKKNYTVGVIGMRGNPGEQVILLLSSTIIR